MIEPGPVRSHLIKKVLPFALALGIGVLSASASRHFGSRATEPQGHGFSTPVSHSRTWLIVKSHSSAPEPVVAHGMRGHQVAQVRARFGSDGKVSQVVPLSGSLPEGLLPGVTAAAQRIRCIPPTEDGRPLAATVDVSYELNAVCACGNDLLDDGGCEGGHLFWPFSLQVGIVSIEAAREPEGWRVIYE